MKYLLQPLYLRLYIKSGYCLTFTCQSNYRLCTVAFLHIQIWQEHRVDASEIYAHYLRIRYHQRNHILYLRYFGIHDPTCLIHKFLYRQICVPLLPRTHESVLHSGTQSELRIGLISCGLGNLIRSFKTYSLNIIYKAIWVILYQSKRVSPVCLISLRRLKDCHAKPLKSHVYVSGTYVLHVGLVYCAVSCSAYTRDIHKPLRFLFYDLKRFVTKKLYQFSRRGLTYASYKAA